MRPHAARRAALEARSGYGQPRPDPGICRLALIERLAIGLMLQLMLALLLCFARTATADEIRGAELAAPGHFELEQRFGYSTTTFAPATGAGPPLVQHGITGETEIAYGLTEWWDIALTSPYSFERQENPLVAQATNSAAGSSLQTGGLTIRQMFLQPDREERDVYFGVMIRGGYAPPGAMNVDLFTANPRQVAGAPEFIMEAAPRYFGEISPIVGWRFGDGYQLLFNANFNFAVGSAGSSFEPNLRLVKHLTRKLALGFEYFSNWGPIGQLVPFKQQQQRLLAITQIKALGLEWNLGLGAGLTPASAGIAANFGIEKEL
jgi:hypothetical protein